jgi:O-antigen/teichoic acid export membrane protein
VRPNVTRLLVRNVSHLGIGQIASTALGILLSAVIGRALEPAQLGILYTVFAISSFAYVIVDWGQGTYLVREMARGRTDEPAMIGSALAIRLAAVVLMSAVIAAVAMPLGYSGQIVVLTLLAMMSGIPATLFAPFSCAFRSRDRMDVDAFVGIIGKAMTLVATAIVLHLGGGLKEVILMLAVGGASTLLAGAIAASRLDITVRAPAAKLLRELLRHGAPLATFSLVVASQPFIEIMMLSMLAGSAVVGWYGASTNIRGIVLSPAMILLAATFPQLSRASRSLPDLRRMIDATARVMFIAAAFTSSALYLFADHMVAIIYGQGRFVETASILRVSAIFVPLLFLVLVLASAMNAVGRNNAMAVISVFRIVLCVIFNWLFIGYFQQRFGNGAIGLVIIAGLAEIPATMACWALLPRGAVGSAVSLNAFRAYVASLCTVVPLSVLQPLGLWSLIPLFGSLFVVSALITRLVSPQDLRLAMEAVRSKMLGSLARRPAPETCGDGDAGGETGRDGGRSHRREET